MEIFRKTFFLEFKKKIIEKNANTAVIISKFIIFFIYIQQNSSRIDPNFLYDSNRLVSYATQLRNTLGSI